MLHEPPAEQSLDFWLSRVVQLEPSAKSSAYRELWDFFAKRLDAVDVLLKWLEHEETAIRDAAVFMLMEMGPYDEGEQAQFRRLLQHPDPEVRCRVLALMEDWEPDLDAASRRLVFLSFDPALDVRVTAVVQLFRQDRASLARALRSNLVPYPTPLAK